MSNNVEVKPTPIQRNYLDVATELTQLFHATNVPTSREEIAETYAMFYILAVRLPGVSYEDAKQFLPKEIQDKFNK